MQDFEKLGVFYLGRAYDLNTRTSASDAQNNLVLYDSRDLVTHAVCVGMTGSGKTGLCLSLLEEAAIDGIPAIVVDPKGDLANLLLQFPSLQPADFRPWINEDDARRNGVAPDDFAAQQAQLWQKGLAKWGQDGARIQRLKDAADFDIYTPGSEAGIPVSVLKSFAAPSKAILDDRELFRDRITATATSLLALLGIDADPIQSREHILLSNLLSKAWEASQDLSIADLIQQIQDPPIRKIGVLDLESFYPAKDRFSLAMQLNNLLASPGFEAWLDGQPLEIANILYTPQGKPRIAIFSIAHLSDAERMFFVSLLLNQMLSWVRSQSGTTSLRALFYMDEIFGYFPPIANPPSKKPLLTLLKQARAFGVGVMLATQNPVDLDYKGLANCGTWFIGRLQTERDKQRVLDGLEGASEAAGAKFDKSQMDKILSGLGNRIFLMNNVHENGPEILETRWALCYLRGPLTRDQIRILMHERKPEPASAKPKAATVAIVGADSTRPVLPPELQQFFLPVALDSPGASLLYQPMVYAALQTAYSDPKLKLDYTEDLHLLAEVNDGALPVNWADAEAIDVTADALEQDPKENAYWADVPAPALKVKNYAAWAKDLTTWVLNNRKLELFQSGSTGTRSEPNESEKDFRLRIQQQVREARDQAIDELRRKYQPDIDRVNDKIRRAQQQLQEQKAQSTSQSIQAVLSIGATVATALFGRKTISQKVISEAASAARNLNKARKESQDVDIAGENMSTLQQQLQQLQDAMKTETEAIQKQMDATTEELEKLTIKPKKTNISLRLISLVWVPFYRDPKGAQKPAWKT